MKYINIIKTYYPHWGAHTAFNQIGKYFDSKHYRIRIKDVPMGNEDFKFPLFKNQLKRYFLKKIKKRKVAAYLLNDLAAEISVFLRSSIQKTHIIHYFDGEHTLMFLPGWLRKYRPLGRKPKIIAMFHQPPPVLESLLNINIVKKVDCVLVVSPTQEEYFKRYLPGHHIQTILLGVDTDYFKPVNKEKNPGKFKCLAGGKWLRDYDAVIKTARILKEYRDIEFHIVSGKFEVPPDLDNLYWHENISDAELLTLYQTSDILFMPFKDATANTFLLEGSACGLPVVSSDIPAVRAYFPGNESALVKENDPKVFAGIILDLHRSPGKCKKMAADARKRALDLSWKNIVKEYIALYENV